MSMFFFKFLNISEIVYLLILTTLINYISTEEPKKLLLGVNNEKIEVKEDCEFFVLPTNYKHLTINIDKTKNIDKIIITDQKLDSCQQKTCSPLSNICQSNLFEKYFYSIIYSETKKIYFDIFQLL